jgi:hypothetical protein
MFRTIKAAIVFGWLLIPLLASSQAFEWNRTFGRFGLMFFANDVATDEESNSYTTGYFSGTVDFDPGPNVYNLVSEGGYDIFIVKLNSDGELVWARRMGGNQFDVGVSVAVHNGFVYITGHFQSTSFEVSDNLPSLSTTGLSDTYISKLDYNGNVHFAGSIGGPAYNDTPGCITVDNEGNVMLTGYFSGTADFDPSSANFNVNSNAGNTVVYILKLNADCQLQWARYIRGFGLNNSQMGISIAANDTRDIYVTGYFSGTADFDPGASDVLVTATGANDTFVLKLTEDGLFTWIKQIGGSFSVRPLDICVDGNQNLLICGKFIQTVDLDPNSGSLVFDSNTTDIYVVKLDAQGSLIWGAAFGGSSTDVPNSICKDTANNIYITGRFGGGVDFNLNDNSSGFLTAISGSDAFLCVLTPTGDFIWNMSFAGAGSEEGNGVSVTSTGEVLVCGNFTSTTDFDFSTPNTATPPKGNQDGFLVKINQSDFCPWILGADCDDNDPCTMSDQIQSDCTCMGVFVDSDGDAVCDALDVCASGAEPGSPCDDGDACTINDVIREDCGCSGALSDTDFDGTCDAYDMCPGGPEVGASCNDNNPCTINDIVTNDCVCIGSPSVPQYVSINHVQCGAYSWNGQQLASTGLYQDTLQNQFGCDSIVTLNLTILQFSYAAQSILASAATITAGSSIVLNANGGSLGNGAQWVWYSNACGGNQLGVGNNLSVTPTATTSYYVRAEGSCNTTECTSLQVIVNPVTCGPTTISATATAICSGTSTQLAVQGYLATGAVWKWYKNGCGAGASIGTGPTLTASPTTNTTYFVRAEGGTCGISSCLSIAIAVSTTPNKPVSIFGPTSGMCAIQNISYSIASVAGVSSYQWTVPTGVTITSGQGTNQITVNFGTGIGNNNSCGNPSICVRSVNSCGFSAYQCLLISTLPTAPSSITGSTAPCMNQVSSYSCPSVIGASSYQWSVPSGWSINSGQGSSQASIIAGSGTGSISVKAVNACGQSPNKSITVRAKSCIVSMPMEINIWPNPASERLNIDVESDAALNYQIFNLSGEKILEGIIKSSVDISGLAAGIYIIHVAVNEESYFEKIIVSN